MKPSSSCVCVWVCVCVCVVVWIERVQIKCWHGESAVECVKQMFWLLQCTTCKYTILVCSSLASGPSPVFNRNNSWIRMRNLQWRCSTICLWGSMVCETAPYLNPLQANYQSWVLWKKQTCGIKRSVAPQPRGNQHPLTYAGTCRRQTHTSLPVTIT